MQYKQLQCFLTKNYNYTMKGSPGKYPRTPSGILIHSTGDGGVDGKYVPGYGSKNLKRYAQPSESDAKYRELIEAIGVNLNNNSWNKPDKWKCVHYMLGKLENGEYAVVQLLPDNMCCWGAGKGSNGSYNYDPMYLQIEIQEGNPITETYPIAVDWAAQMCRKYGWTSKNITSHDEAHKLKYASGHADPTPYFALIGKTIEDFRNDVQQILNGWKIPELQITPNASYISGVTNVESGTRKVSSNGIAVLTPNNSENKTSIEIINIDNKTLIYGKYGYKQEVVKSLDNGYYGKLDCYLSDGVPITQKFVNSQNTSAVDYKKTFYIQGGSGNQNTRFIKGNINAGYYGKYVDLGNDSLKTYLPFSGDIDYKSIWFPSKVANWGVKQVINDSSATTYKKIYFWANKKKSYFYITDDTEEISASKKTANWVPLKDLNGTDINSPGEEAFVTFFVCGRGGDSGKSITKSIEAYTYDKTQLYSVGGAGGGAATYGFRVNIYDVCGKLSEDKPPKEIYNDRDWFYIILGSTTDHNSYIHFPKNKSVKIWGGNDGQEWSDKGIGDKKWDKIITGKADIGIAGGGKETDNISTSGIKADFTPIISSKGYRGGDSRPSGYYTSVNGYRPFRIQTTYTEDTPASYQKDTMKATITYGNMKYPTTSESFVRTFTPQKNLIYSQTTTKNDSYTHGTSLSMIMGQGGICMLSDGVNQGYGYGGDWSGVYKYDVLFKSGILNGQKSSGGPAALILYY